MSETVDIIPDSVKNLDVSLVEEKQVAAIFQSYVSIKDHEGKYWYARYLAAWSIASDREETHAHIKDMLIHYIDWLGSRDASFGEALGKLRKSIFVCQGSNLRTCGQVIASILEGSDILSQHFRAIEDNRLFLTKKSTSPMPYILLGMSTNPGTRDKLKQYLRRYAHAAITGEIDRLSYQAIRSEYFSRQEIAEILSTMEQESVERATTVRSHRQKREATLRLFIHNEATVNRLCRMLDHVAGELPRVSTLSELNQLLADQNSVSQDRADNLAALLCLIVDNFPQAIIQLRFVILSLFISLMSAVELGEPETGEGPIEHYLPEYLRMYREDELNFHSKRFIAGTSADLEVEFRLSLHGQDLDYSSTHPFIIALFLVFERLGGYSHYEKEVKGQDPTTQLDRESIAKALAAGAIVERYFVAFFAALVYMVSHHPYADQRIIARTLSVLLLEEPSTFERLLELLRDRKGIVIDICQILGLMINYVPTGTVKILFDYFEKFAELKGDVKERYKHQKELVLNYGSKQAAEAQTAAIGQIISFIDLNKAKKPLQQVVAFLEPLSRWLTEGNAGEGVFFRIFKSKVIGSHCDLYCVISNSTKNDVILVAPDSLVDDSLKMLTGIKIGAYSDFPIKLATDPRKLSAASIRYASVLDGKQSTRRESVDIRIEMTGGALEIRPLVPSSLEDPIHYFPHVDGYPFSDFRESQSFLIRDELESEISEFLAQSDVRAPFVVTGVRRIGKTSMLNYMWQKFESKPNYLLIGGPPDRRMNSIKSYLKKLTSELSRELDLDKAFVINHYNDPDLEAEDFCEFLTIVMQKCKSRGINRIVVFVDEMENLFTEDSLYLDFFQLIKRVLSSNAPAFSKLISFALFGSNLIARFFVPVEGSSIDTRNLVWYRSCPYYEIPPVSSSADVEKMVFRPLRNAVPRLQVEPKALDRILSATGGFPYLIHNMGFELVRLMREESAATINEYDVICAEQRMRNKADVFALFFEQINYEKVADKETKIRYLLYHALLWIMNNYYNLRQPITADFLQRELADREIAVRQDDLIRHISALISHKLIVSDAQRGYRVSGSLLSGFIRSYVDSGKVFKELSLEQGALKSCDILDRLGVEGADTEYKSTLSYDLHLYLENRAEQKRNSAIERSCLKTIIAFLNARHLEPKRTQRIVIGVSEDKADEILLPYDEHRRIFGLEHELASPGCNEDKYRRWAVDIISKYLPTWIIKKYLRINTGSYRGRLLLEIEVSPADEVFYVVEKSATIPERKCCTYYHRVDGRTDSISSDDPIAWTELVSRQGGNWLELDWPAQTSQ